MHNQATWFVLALLKPTQVGEHLGGCTKLQQEQYHAGVCKRLRISFCTVWCWHIAVLQQTTKACDTATAAAVGVAMSTLLDTAHKPQLQTCLQIDGVALACPTDHVQYACQPDSGLCSRCTTLQRPQLRGHNSSRCSQTGLWLCADAGPTACT